MTFAAGLLVGALLSNELNRSTQAHRTVEPSFASVQSVASAEEAAGMPDYKPVRYGSAMMPAGAVALAQSVERGMTLALVGKKHRNKVFTVLNVTPSGFQYGEEINGKFPNPQFLRFSDYKRVVLN